MTSRHRNALCRNDRLRGEFICYCESPHQRLVIICFDVSVVWGWISCWMERWVISDLSYHDAHVTSLYLIALSYGLLRHPNTAHRVRYRHSLYTQIRSCMFLKDISVEAIALVTTLTVNQYNRMNTRPTWHKKASCQSSHSTFGHTLFIYAANFLTLDRNGLGIC